MKAGFQNTENIEFSNPTPVRCWVFWTKTVFDWHRRNKHVDPITFRRENGDLIRMFNEDHGKTDFASTPPVSWCVPGFSPQRFVFQATFHDDFYKEHKARLSTDDGKTWMVIHIIRRWADDFLEEAIRNDPEPATEAEQWFYRQGVRIGGADSWS
ncbi:MAG: hypothetical protein WC736_15275 [Gallionella sp.]|jgi:hypothetical protein